MWSDNVRILDEESWFDAIKGSESLSSAGAWYTLSTPDGYTKKFQPSKWTDLVTNDEEFRARVVQIMDEEIVQKFDKREGDASTYYEDQDDLTVPVNE